MRTLADWERSSTVCVFRGNILMRKRGRITTIFETMMQRWEDTSKATPFHPRTGSILFHTLALTPSVESIDWDCFGLPPAVSRLDLAVAMKALTAMFPITPSDLDSCQPAGTMTNATTHAGNNGNSVIPTS